MLFDRHQQASKAAGDIRANGLALHRTRNAEHHDLVDGHREVVAPELRDAFEKRALGTHGMREARERFVDLDGTVKGGQLERGADGLARIHLAAFLVAPGVDDFASQFQGFFQDRG